MFLVKNNSNSRGKVVLIDGNSLLYRAFFALPHFSTLENQPTNAVYGFTMMILRILETETPDVMIVAFDAPVKTFRHEEYVEYKAHRKKAPDDLKSQGPLAREVVDAFNLPMLEVEGVEADDVIGTLARKASSECYDVVIVTGDLDALQLVNDRVKVMTTVKGVSETVVYDDQAVEARYGLKPSQLIDYKALKGDASDNIPGVAGIGDITARKLISEYGNLENLLSHVEDITNARLQKKLVDGTEQAKLSKWLATIITDVPIDIDLDACRLKKPDDNRLRELFKRLEFRTLLKKLPEPVEESGQPNLFSGPAEKTAVPTLTLSNPDIDLLVSEIRSCGEMSILINGTTPRGVEAEPVGIAISAAIGKSYYISLGAESSVSLDGLRSLLESDSIRKYGHNLKYEMELAKRAGIDIKGPTFDVMLAAYLINPTRGTHSLEEVASYYAGIELQSHGTKTGTLPGFEDESTPDELFGARADAVFRLVPILDGKLQSDGFAHLMYDVEMPLVPVLADMEINGVSVDVGWLHELSGRLGARIAEIEREIYVHAGTEFNIGSPKQLQMILFEKLGLPSSKKTKTGYSTDADTLAALAPAHEIVAKILEYRELTKLKSTYSDSLPKLINPHTGRIHSSLNQAVTSTGRLSSSEPNLQNIPIKTEIGREIRKAFVASSGNVLVSADYSQIELRILAHITHDPELIAAYRGDKDIHTRTASTIFEVPEDEVTSDMRRQAKTVNFAVIYGMSDYGLSRELNIPPSVAKHYISSYFKQYAGVKAFELETLEIARTKGYVESIMGRRRYIPELNSSNRNFREFAERAAVNMPIQGTAADIVKIAMIRIYKQLTMNDFKSKLILQVHDELVFDVPESEVRRIIQLVKHEMENACTLDVPLKVDVKTGRDWCSAQPISAEEYLPEDL